MTTHTNPAISSRTMFSLPYRDHSWASAVLQIFLEGRRVFHGFSRVKRFDEVDEKDV
jgi:hypothetical protein